MVPHNVTFAPDAIRHRVQDMIDNHGWHPSDVSIRKHAIWTLGVDFACDRGLWPCTVDVDVSARRATLS